jgi:hypothetical protein
MEGHYLPLDLLRAIDSFLINPFENWFLALGKLIIVMLLKDQIEGS